MSRRARAFIIVGALGFIVQLTALSALSTAGLSLPIATALAVEAAVLHNFVWHERWTWRDRAAGGGWPSRLIRFHSANAAVSLLVNVVLTWAFARLLHAPALVANTLAVAAASVVNFAAADRWVFARAATAALVLWPLTVQPASAAEPPPRALAAWTRFVFDAESPAPARPAACEPLHEPAGDAVKVPGGTIYRWSSCTIVKGVTVPALIDALVASGTPPPQEDVLESRVLARDGDRLRVYLKLVRRTVVTVSYDTEHDMTFRRVSPHLATSRSVATSIAQTDGGDYGFLWRLNSYWTYRQVGDDVQVDLVSLSLSRDVPLLLRPMAAPLINSVARESMQRTLTAVRQFGEHEARGRTVKLRRVDAP